MKINKSEATYLDFRCCRNYLLQCIVLSYEKVMISLWFIGYSIQHNMEFFVLLQWNCFLLRESQNHSRTQTSNQLSDTAHRSLMFRNARGAASVPCSQVIRLLYWQAIPRIYFFPRHLPLLSIHGERVVVSFALMNTGASEGSRRWLAILTKQVSHNNQASQTLCNQKPRLPQVVPAHRPLFWPHRRRMLLCHGDASFTPNALNSLRPGSHYSEDDPCWGLNWSLLYLFQSIQFSK